MSRARIPIRLAPVLAAMLLLALTFACGTTTETVTEIVEVEKEVIVEKEVVKEVEVPGETVTIEKEVIKTVEVAGETVVVEKEVVKVVEPPTRTGNIRPIKVTTGIAAFFNECLIITVLSRSPFDHAVLM